LFRVWDRWHDAFRCCGDDMRMTDWTTSHSKFSYLVEDRALHVIQTERPTQPCKLMWTSIMANFGYPTLGPGTLPGYTTPRLTKAIGHALCPTQMPNYLFRHEHISRRLQEEDNVGELSISFKSLPISRPPSISFPYLLQGHPRSQSAISVKHPTPLTRYLVSHRPLTRLQPKRLRTKAEWRLACDFGPPIARLSGHIQTPMTSLEPSM
jgi:hypothetical protein